MRKYLESNPIVQTKNFGRTGMLCSRVKPEIYGESLYLRRNHEMPHGGRKTAEIFAKYVLIATLLSLSAGLIFPSLTHAQQDQEDASDERTVSGWMRVDLEPRGLDIWVGASYYLAEILDLATDARLAASSAEAQFDLGLAIYLGPVSLTPMLGIVFDFDPEELRPEALSMPQLFTIIDGGIVYFESWIQLFFHDLFAEAQSPHRDYFYTRNFLLIVLGSAFAIGPQFEIDVSFNNAGEEPLVSLPLGGRINLGYGDGNVFGLFLGYEFKKNEDALGLTGRFSFVRNF